MKYSHDYTKLKNSEYTTIRRYKKAKLHEIVFEKFPSGSQKSQIIKIERKALDDIPLLILLTDTDCKSRKEAYKLFQSFYKKPINFKEDLFYIYHLKVIQHFEGFKRGIDL